MILSDRMVDRYNNLDFIRLIAALMVIYAHSYPLALGRGHVGLLATITHGKLDAGTFGVTVFFILSGFLITMSYERSNDLGYFFKSRILRLFPALFTVLFLTIFLLGLFMTDLNAFNYFLNFKTYTYLQNITLFKMQWGLPGVFTHNIYQNAINGSLWTLKYEFSCYLVVAFLGVIKCLNKYVGLILFLFVAVCDLPGIREHIPHIQYVHFLVYFSFGMIIYFYRHKVKLNIWYAITSLIVLILSLTQPIFIIGFYLFVGYLLFYIGFHPRIKLNHLTRKYGDLSYGIYIIAFPVQQSLIFFFGGSMNPLLCLLTAMPITILFAYASWHLVEKRALNLKRKKITIKKSKQRTA